MLKEIMTQKAADEAMTELLTTLSNLTKEELEKEWKNINSIRCLVAAMPQVCPLIFI